MLSRLRPGAQQQRLLWLRWGFLMLHDLPTAKPTHPTLAAASTRFGATLEVDVPAAVQAADSPLPAHVGGGAAASESHRRRA